MASKLVGGFVAQIRMAITLLLALLNKDVRQSLQQSRVLFESASDGIWESNLNGKILRVNAAGLAMLGYQEEEVLGRNFEIFVAKSNRPRLYDAMNSLNQPGAVDVSEWQLITKDGAFIDVEISAKIYSRRTIYGFVRDITIRKSFERRWAFLASLSAQLSQTMEYEERVRISADVMTPRYADLCVVSMVENDEVHLRAVATSSDRTRTRLQGSSEQVNLKEPNQFSAYEVIKNRRPIFIKDVQSEILDREDVGLKYKAYLEDLGITSFISMPLISRGRVVGLFEIAMQNRVRRFAGSDLAFFEEIADRCAVAIDNADLYQRAQAAAHSRELVLSIVSHDIRNPMANIDLSLQMLNASVHSGVMAAAVVPSEVVKKTVSRIKSSLQSMDRLIADLLDFGKIQAGTLSVKMEPVEVSALVHTAVEPFEEKCRQKNLKLITQIDDGVSFVRCDSVRLIQVLWNLIGNSLKFTPSGGEIRLSATLESDKVHFVVSDTGCGVNREELGKIFERFWQSKEAAELGYGLGLSIAKGIVVSHGGKIWAESTKGRGTEIHFSIPIDPHTPSPEVQSAPYRELFKSLRGIRILAVDDAPENLVLLKMFLEKAGAEFHFSENVRGALRLLDEVRPTLVLTDIELGRESGFDLLRRIRLRDGSSQRRTPVIAMTAHADAAYKNKMSATDFDLVFQKPVLVEQLIDAIARLSPRHSNPVIYSQEAGT